MEKSWKPTRDTAFSRLRDYAISSTVGADFKEDLRTFRTNLGMLQLDLGNAASSAKSLIKKESKYRLPARESVPVLAATTGIVIYLAGAEDVSAQYGACEHLTYYGYSEIPNGQPGMECMENTLDGISGNEARVTYYPSLSTPESDAVSTSVFQPMSTPEIPQLVLPTFDVPTITIPTIDIPEYPTFAPIPTFEPWPTMDLDGLFDPSATDVPASTPQAVDWVNTPIGEHADEILVGTAAVVGVLGLGLAGITIWSIAREGATSINNNSNESELQPAQTGRGRAYDMSSGQPFTEGRRTSRTRQQEPDKLAGRGREAPSGGLIHLGDNVYGEPIYGDGKNRYDSDGRRLKGEGGLLESELKRDRDIDRGLGF